MSKLFIIGLPRTGTTSISVALLKFGFKVAHTAYTKHAFELADVISDAPCFSDYQQLDPLFPDSKFVYLDRDLELWVPSMQKLLKKMHPQLTPKTGYLNPVLKRSFEQTFKVSNTLDPFSKQHLESCYQMHQKSVYDFFSGRDDFLSINLSDSRSFHRLCQFLNISEQSHINFPHLNIGKQVDSWKELKHPNKVNSNSAGKEHRKFFNYG
tara:strand:- start:211 stop:840 length:630 start_codon:yes stop_codon:yes gene_type:complete